MLDFTAGYEAMRREVAAVRVPRDVVVVRGPDALSFLQGQLSQDLDRLGPGESAWTLLLEPQGKIDALLRITREADDALLLDVEGGFGNPVIERLRRFKIRVKVEFEHLSWDAIAVRGPGSASLSNTEAAVVAPVEWAGVGGLDLLGPDVGIPAGVPEAPREAYEAVRVEAGVPAMGSELDQTVIPEEAGLVDSSVSFTKGCYVGQELVARIDSRGRNVPRRLRGIVVGGNATPPVGAEIVAIDGGVVGRLTSVAQSLDRHASVALAFVKRSVEPPSDVKVTWAGGDAEARVEALPLV